MNDRNQLQDVILARGASSALLRSMKGKSASEIDSPSLVVSLPIVKRNMLMMKNYVELHNERKRVENPSAVFNLRPHFKMHKSLAVSKMLVNEGGAVGMCVQKISEAEVLATMVKNILITNEVVSKSKLLRVLELAERLNTSFEVSSTNSCCSLPSSECCTGSGVNTPWLGMCVDSVEGVKLLSEVLATWKSASSSQVLLHVFLEIDVGQNRGGVDPCEDDILPVMNELKKLLMTSSKSSHQCTVHFSGLLAYQGAAQHFRTYEERCTVVENVAKLSATSKRIVEDRCQMKVYSITGAGTGTFTVETHTEVYTEIQPGSYLFFDRDYAMNENDAQHPRQVLFWHALFLKTQVSKVSDRQRRVVVDGGHKSSAIDSGLPILAPFQVKHLFKCLSSKLMQQDARESYSKRFPHLDLLTDPNWTDVGVHHKLFEMVPRAEHFIECGNGGDDHGLFQFGQDIVAGSDSSDATILRFFRKFTEVALLSEVHCGDTLWLVPGHVDPTCNLHDYLFALRPSSGNCASSSSLEDELQACEFLLAEDGAAVDEVWSVDARGCQH